MNIGCHRIECLSGPTTRLRVGVSTFAALTVAAVLFAGCGETRPSNFYLLSAVAETPQVQNGGRGTERQASLGVGPVELPKYLDRVQMVSFSTANRVDISEFDRWAEPLTDNFTTVLGENLAAILPAARIDVYPFMTVAPRAFERQVLVDVVQFRLTSVNKVELKASWTIVEPSRRTKLAGGSFATLEPVDAAGAEAVVASMSRAVGALSRDIASALIDISKGG